MTIIKRLFGWLRRKVVLYFALVLAIGVATVLTPWVKQVVAGRMEPQRRAEILAEMATMVAAERKSKAAAFSRQAASLRSNSLEALKDRESSLRAEQAELKAAIGKAGRPWVLALVDREELLRNERRKLRLAVIDQELRAVTTAREAVVSDLSLRSAVEGYERQYIQASGAHLHCDAAKLRLRAYEESWRGRLRRFVDNDEHRTLVKKATDRCAAARAADLSLEQHRRFRQEKIAIQQRTAEAFTQAAKATDVINNAGADLLADAEKARTEFAGSLPQKIGLWAERVRLRSLLGEAAVALALIIAMPFLIRLFCYFVLAPIAMRRPAIQLRVPDGKCTTILPAVPSAISVPVRLAPGEELLVRQDYLQTSSHAGAKGTQWFLDWRTPVTSVATGLTFLTRIRGEGEVTTVSAVRDGLAEVTILTLPDGAACVMHPRALAAVVQPVRRRLRITRHWRLGSLNAWLTLQLRFLVFHGPARLVLKGGRGVRVERAERGRVFGQDQLASFSADLSYAVTRTETFWPYFLGREQLFKDRILGGEGVLIVEEVPFSTRRGEVRRGLEGMIDAGMKAFGM